MIARAALILVAAIATTIPARAQPDPGMIPLQLLTPANAPPGVDPLTQFAADVSVKIMAGAQARLLIASNLVTVTGRVAALELVTTVFAPRITALEAKPDLTPRVVLLEARPIVPDLSSRVTTLEARAPVPGPQGIQGVAGKDSTVPGPPGANGIGIKGDPGIAGKDGQSITGAAGPGYTLAIINGAGHLIVTKTDGTTSDLGNVLGAAGAAGGVGATGSPGSAGKGVASSAVNAAGHLMLTMTDGTTSDAGLVVGATGQAGASIVGAAGPSGRGVTTTAINSSGHLIVTLTDGSSVDAGMSVGAMGPAGASITGPAGPAGASITGQTGATGAAGKDGLSITGPAGPAGIVPFYGSSGLIAGIKCWQGAATTTTGGAWSVSYASAGFTAVPNVESQAISPSGALSGLLFSTITAPTATAASGVTALAGVGGLGGAGAVVMVRACGV